MSISPINPLPDNGAPMSPVPAHYILRSDYDRAVTKFGRCAIVTGIILGPHGTRTDLVRHPAFPLAH